VPYFEYIRSEANWADEISRDGAQGNWAPHNALSVGECEEKEIDAFVATEVALKGQEQRLQVTRVRHAWTAVRQNGLRKESRNTVSPVAELDDLLEEGTLREVKVQFWKRYKVKYPVEVIPSDQLLSRCYREMEKRLLAVYDVWKVKNLMHRVMTTKKRKQVGTDLYTFEDEAETMPEVRGVEKYLAMLHTHLLALATAGSNKVSGAPSEEVFGNDSTKFVKVPWDVLQAYHLRASRSVMLIPEASRLSWLEGKDIAERAVWVSQFREGAESLGQVVHSVMEKRGAHWDAPIGVLVVGRPAFPPQPPPPFRFKEAEAVGLDIGEITREESRGAIPSRRRMSTERGQTLAADEVYVGHGHHSHRHGASRWASPFTVGQHGTVEEYLIMYTDYISSSLPAEEIKELVGKRLLSDTPEDIPCTADLLTAMAYYAWRNGSLELPQEDVKPRKRVQLAPNKWSRRALSLTAATVGDAWRTIYSKKGSMARQPPLSLEQVHRGQQQAITETFGSYFPEEIFEGSQFPHIEDVVKLPAFSRYAERVERRGIPPGCSRPPSQVGEVAALAAGGAEGVQISAFSHQATLPPLVGFGLSADQHFEKAMAVAEGVLPTEKSAMVDEDLKYAAAMMVGSRFELHHLGNEAITAVRASLRLQVDLFHGENQA